MDITAERLTNKLRELEREIHGLQQQKAAIKTSLQLAGVRPNADDADEEYAKSQPFLELSLIDTCKHILWDFPNTPLSKSEVEYLAVRGGYVSTAKDSVNSIEITLRRLAAAGFCKVNTGKGPKPNTYIYQSKKGETMPPPPNATADSESR